MKKIISIFLIFFSSLAFSAPGNDIIKAGSAFIGVPYKFGASLNSVKSFDCSSFIWRSFYNAKLGSLPRDSRSQNYYLSTHKKVATRVPFSMKSIQAGDILFWKNTASHASAGKVTHVGIYLGNGMILHAKPGKGVVKEAMSSYYRSTSRVHSAYRVIGPVN